MKEVVHNTSMKGFAPLYSVFVFIFLFRPRMYNTTQALVKEEIQAFNFKKIINFFAKLSATAGSSVLTLGVHCKNQSDLIIVKRLPTASSAVVSKLQPSTQPLASNKSLLKIRNVPIVSFCKF